MEIIFYPTDIQYTVKKGKPIIQLYGRTTDGKQICALDEKFEPYFYALGEADYQDIEEKEYKVVRAEKVSKTINEKEAEIWKLYVNLPKAVPILKDIVRKIPGVKKIYEYDVLFTRRYLLDKNITMLTKTKITGKKTATNSRVECFSIDTIKPDSDEVLKPKILAIDIETYNPENKIDTKKNPIIMIGLYGKEFSRVITWKKFKTKEKYIEFVPSEADMLQRFVELTTDYGPDFITGYFTDGFDFPYIVDRAKQLKIKLDIGLDYSDIEMYGKIRKEARIKGITHIDIYKFIRKVIARSLKTDTYSLDAVSKELLGAQKHDVDMDYMFKAWDKGNEEIEPFCKYNLQDSKLTYDLTEKVLPNLIEFVRVIKLPPYDINRMTFSTFVEWYLINKAVSGNGIILNRPSRTKEMTRMGDRVKGAFVYEPKPGFYHDIMVFDYRSLYPSIIASHNISKGTINCKCCEGPKIETERGEFWYCQKQKGFFSTIISELILLRASVKKELKKKKEPLLAARSEALKVLANSFYGYMGFAPARWYCIECAESTTAWARHYIHTAIDKAKKAGFTVLYSDTDSVFLLLGKQKKEDALKLVDGINKELPELMELDYEGYYPAGIFVSIKAGEGGAKKKYALIDEQDNMTIKGFETVRRNWSLIAKETQKEVLRILLKENDAEKAKKHVRDVVERLRNNKVELNKVIIHTALTKSIESYAAIGPHVAAAQKMQDKGKTMGAGSIVDYVVCKGKGRIRDKVKLPEDVNANDYDGDYYIEHQVLPGVERIFAVLKVDVKDLTSKTKQSSLSNF